VSDEQKEQLVAQSPGCTLEGIRASLGGWRNDYATLSPDFGGFWRVDWETVKRVISGDKNFLASDVSFSSWAWVGFSDSKVPEAMRRRFPYRFREVAG
jgi:hypothetical protein